MSDPIVELSRLRAEMDAKLLRAAKRQFSWLAVLFIFPGQPSLYGCGLGG